jgi:hypothetical protein
MQNQLPITYEYSRSKITAHLRKKSERITVREASEVLGCTYENARRIIKRMCEEKPAMLVKAPFLNPTGHAVFVEPTNTEYIQKLKVMAAGNNIITWRGEPFVPNDFIDELALQIWLESGPTTQETIEQMLTVFGYSILEDGDAPNGAEIVDEDPMSKQEKAEMRINLAMKKEAFDALSEFIGSILNNPAAWEE